MILEKVTRKKKLYVKSVHAKARLLTPNVSLKLTGHGRFLLVKNCVKIEETSQKDRSSYKTEWKERPSVTEFM